MRKVGVARTEIQRQGGSSRHIGWTRLRTECMAPGKAISTHRSRSEQPATNQQSMTAHQQGFKLSSLVSVIVPGRSDRLDRYSACVVGHLPIVVFPPLPSPPLPSCVPGVLLGCLQQAPCLTAGRPPSVMDASLSHHSAPSPSDRDDALVIIIVVLVFFPPSC